MPGRFRHFPRLHIRYQSFDLTVAHLVDKKTGQLLSRIYPQDKVKNAAGFRRIKEPPESGDPSSANGRPDPSAPEKTPGGLCRNGASSGLPPQR